MRLPPTDSQRHFVINNSRTDIWLVVLVKDEMKFVELSKCCEFIKDGTHSSPDRTNEGIPVLSATHVRDGRLDFNTDRFTTQKELELFSKRLNLKKGDVLLTIVGSIGRTAIITNERPLVFQRSVCVLRPKPECLNAHYFRYALESNEVKQQLERETREVAQAGIYLEAINGIKIPLPPLEEQKRIASIAQKCDRLRRTRRYTHQLSDGYLRSVFIEMFGECFADYPSTPLGEIVTITGGGTPSRDVPAYFEGNIPWLTSKDMKGNYIFDTQEHITEEAIRKSATKLVPKKSILLVVKSKVLMHRLPMAITGVELCHGQDIKSIQCSKKVNPYFLVYVLKHNEKQLLIRARGANTEGLTLPMLEAIPVPDVDISIQEKFAQVVQRFERLCAQQREADRQAEHLFQTVLHRAFRGEL